MAQFDRVWSSEEPDFVKYFHQNYEIEQVRRYNYNQHNTQIGCALALHPCAQLHSLSYKQFCIILLENGLKCYSHFDHGYTDTNMYVERYVTS